MDSNGRQRATSSSSIGLPTSSTFRKLPSLGRSSFRRNDKAADSSSLGAHQRGSTFPSLTRVLGDDPATAFFTTPTEPRHYDASVIDTLDASSNHLLPPSRTSSLPQTPSNLSQSTLTFSPDMSISYEDTSATTRYHHTPHDDRLTRSASPGRTPPTNATPALDVPTKTTANCDSVDQGVSRPSSDGGPSRTVMAQRDTDRSEDAMRTRRRADDKPRDAPPAVPEETVRPRERSRRSSVQGVRQTASRIHQAVLPSSKSVHRAPAAAMYFSALPFHGVPPGQPLRAHTGTLVGNRIWFLGGVNRNQCWRGLATYDTETLLWSTVEPLGEQLPPLRAHTTTLVGNKLFIFGGGDGPTYSNEVWTFDTVTHKFARPEVTTPRDSWPLPRRAHTTVLYRHYLVVFGGGNGQAALNDIWALDVSNPSRLSWHEWRTRGNIPQKKGYHTANLVGEKMVVYGGSDGHASFADVHILNLRTLTWTLIQTEAKHNRLSHTSTQVGSYLFILGGHNGATYAQDVLLLNLVTLQWETKSPKGVSPPGRGYHVALLHDARIYISGGYNGASVFDDLWILDLSAGAYLPQVTTFEVDETGDGPRET